VRPTLNINNRTALDAVHACSEYELRMLVDAMHERLPRELRDMIYCYCWDEYLDQFDQYNQERPWRAVALPNRSIESGGPHTVYPHNKAPGWVEGVHFVRPRFVGKEAAREAAEAFYKSAPAYVETLQPNVVYKYFYKDHFGLGVIPRTFITSIAFFLYPCCMHPLTIQGPHSTGNEYVSLSKKALANVLGPNRKKPPQVTFIVRGEKILPALDTIAASRPLYDRLVAAGLTVTLLYYVKLPQSQWHDPERYKPIDLSAIWDEPWREWKQYFMDECETQNRAVYRAVKKQKKFVRGVFQ
jgi:hypothetical protein